MVLNLRPRYKEALKYTKKAKEFLESGNYNKAVYLIISSNQILDRLIFESKNPNPFSQFHSSIDKPAYWTIDILKDLGNNSLILAQTFYQLRDFTNFNIALDNAETYFLDYKEQKKSEESYFDYLNSIISLIDLSEKVQDLEKVYIYLNKYFLSVNETLNEGIKFNQKDLELYRQLSKKYFDYLRKHPDPFNELKHGFALIINQIRELRKYEDIYIGWTEPVLNYLKFLLNNSSELKKEEKNIEFLLTVFLSNVLSILIFQNKTVEINELIISLEDILTLINESRSVDHFITKYKKLFKYYTDLNESDQKIKILERIITLMYKNVEYYDQYSFYLKYIELFDLYKTTNQLNKALELYQVINTLLDSIKWVDDYKDIYNFENEEEFTERIKLAIADLELEYANIKLLQKEFREAKEAYKKVEKIVSTLNDLITHQEIYKSLVNSIRDFEINFNQNSTIGELRDENEIIAELNSELNKNIRELTNHSSSPINVEKRNRALKSAEILIKLENYDKTRQLIDLNELLNYYFYILQHLDLEKDESIIRDLLRRASTLKEYSNRVDPVILASILNGLVNFSLEDEITQLIQEALNLIETKEIDLSRNPSLLADIYFNDGLIKINELNLNKGYDKIDQAISIWEELEKSVPEITNKIIQAKDFLAKCKASLS